MDTLTARACIRYGWATFTKRAWFFIGAIFVYLLAVAVLESISGAIFTRALQLPILTTLVNLAIAAFASMGLITLMLKAHDDPMQAEIEDLWNPKPFWRYLGAYLLFVIIVLVGLILVVVPGVIWGIMFGFTLYLVVDRERLPIEALKESARITKGHRWMLFRLGILSMLIMILGMLCLGVGVLVAMPVAVLASVHAYRTLSSASILLAQEPAVSAAAPAAPLGA